MEAVKRIVAVFLVALMLLTCVPLQSFAGVDFASLVKETAASEGTLEAVAEGECGENLTWSLDAEGTLTVSGEGEMYDYQFNMEFFLPSAYAGLSAEENAGEASVQSKAAAVRVKSEALSKGKTNLISAFAEDESADADGEKETGENGILDFTVDVGELSKAEYFSAAAKGTEAELAPWSEYRQQIKKLVISQGVTSVGAGAFSACCNLESVSLADSVAEIGMYAFVGCFMLDSINLGKVEDLGAGAFAYCFNIDRLDLSSVSELNESVFMYCMDLTEIIFSEELKHIRAGNFGYSLNLRQLYIPASVEEISDESFDIFMVLESIVNKSLTASITGKELEMVSTSDIDISLKCAFVQTEVYKVQLIFDLTDAEIDEYSLVEFIRTKVNEKFSLGIKTYEEFLSWFQDLGRYAISGFPSYFTVYCAEDSAEHESCSRLGINHVIDGETEPHVCFEFSGTSGDISWRIDVDSRELIFSGNGKMADYDAYRAEAPWSTFERFFDRVVFAEDSQVTYIGAGAFYGSKNISTINIPASVKSIGNAAFSDASGLESVTFGEGSALTSFGYSIFSNCTSLKSIEIPASVTSIESSALSRCNKLEEIKVDPENSSFCFENSMLLSADKKRLEFFIKSFEGDVVLPSSLTSIDSYAFTYCEKITTISFEEGSEIYSFPYVSDCPALESVTIPASVSYVSGSFDYCNALANIYVEEGNISYCDVDGILYSGDKSVIYRCPVAKSGKITVADTVKNINSRAFYQCKAVTEIILPEGLENIRDSSFRYCSSLEKITIPATTKHISYYSFEDCNSLNEITVLSGICEIADSSSTFPKGALIKGYTDSSAHEYAKEYNRRFESIGELEETVIASGSCGDNVTWSMTNKRVLTISGTGEMTSHPWTSEYRDSIKTVVIEDGVTSICYEAFYYCRSLENISIPDSVTSISNYAFYDCDGLTGVDIPDSVTAIGSNAFSDCGDLESVKLPSAITEIHYSTFSYCYSLKEITIPDNVTVINDNAFSSCYELETVNIGEKSQLKAIGYNAFSSCNKLKTVTIGENSKLETIGNYAFSNCYALEGFTVPATVKSIGGSAFSNCSAIKTIDVSAENENYTSVDGVLFNKNKSTLMAYPAGKADASYNIPESVTDIGSNAFSGCQIISIDIPETVINIGGGVFSGCQRLESVKLPENSATISAYLFSGCSALTEINIPDSVTTIGSNSFYSCSKLKTVTFGENTKLTDIYSQAFSYCEKLESFTVPKTVKSINWYAFCGCKSLEEIIILSMGCEIDDSSDTLPVNTVIKGYDGSTAEEYAKKNNRKFESLGTPEEEVIASGSCGDNLTWSLTNLSALTISGAGQMTSSPWANEYRNSIKTVVIEDGVISICSNAFYYCRRLENISIPDSVTSIGSYAFYECSSLKEIAIPDGVTEIGESVFRSCSSLEKVTFGENSKLTSIGSDAFYDCSSLKEIAIPDGVTSIGSYAFYDCDGLEAVTFGENSQLTSIGSYAFGYCRALESFTVPQTVTTIGSSAFYDCSALKDITILSYKCSIYDSSSTFPGSTVIKAYTSSTAEDYAEKYNRAFESIGEPEEEIIASGSCGNNATWTLTNHRTLTISGTVVISSNPWSSYNSSIKTVVIEEGITGIIPGMFNNCTTLTTVKIPSTVTYIGWPAQISSVGVFENCGNLKNVIFAENSKLEYIYYAAFRNCDSLAEIQLPDSVKIIEDYAFADCQSLKAFNIPKSCSQVGVSSIRNSACVEEITVDEENESFLALDGVLYNKDKTTLVIYPVGKTDESFDIPDSVKYVSTYAFAYNDYIASVSVPDSVERIYEYAFYDCDKLNTVLFGENCRLGTINSYTFYSCNALASISLPESLTSIGDYAFYSCSKLSAITIPDNVNTIGYRAFNSCSGLKTVTFGENSKLTSIGSYAFGDCYDLESFTVPKGVMFLQDGVFNECDDLNEVTFLNPVCYITPYSIPSRAVIRGYDNSAAQKYAEKYSRTFESLGEAEYEIIASGTCSDTVTWTLDSKGELAVTGEGVLTNRGWSNYTRNIKSIVIEEGITEVDVDVILDEKEVYNLEKITFLNPACKIDTLNSSFGNYGVIIRCFDNSLAHDFAEKHNLTFESMGKTENSIIESGSCGESLTWKLTTDRTLTISGTGTMTSAPWRNSWSAYIKNVVIEDGVTNIYDSAFEDFSKLKAVTFGENSTLEVIGTYAFEGSSLEEISIPDSVISISSYAFNYCRSLKTVTFGEESKLKTIGSSAFRYCTALESFTIPKNTKNIHYNALYNCTGIKEITVLAPECPITNGVLDVSEDVVIRGYTDSTAHDYAVSNNLSFESIGLIPYEVVATGTLDSGVSWELDSRHVLTISGEGAMSSYPWRSSWQNFIKYVVIEDGVTSIYGSAFENCDKLKTVTFGENSKLETIGSNAFRYCTALESLTVPAKVGTIKSGALYNCTSLKQLTILNPDCTITSNSITMAQGGVIKGYTDSTAHDYAVSYNKSFESIGLIPYEVVATGSCGTDVSWTVDSRRVLTISGNGEMTSKPWASSYKTFIKHVVIEDGVTSIYGSAFEDFTKIKTVTFGENSKLEAIGNYAFRNCNMLEEIIIPDSVKQINERAFYDCDKLKTVTFGENSKLEVIGSCAFSHCYALEAISIPDNVKSINESAFYDCNKLKTVTFGENSKLEVIGGYAFYSCNEFEEISIPDSVKSINECAFYDCNKLKTVTFGEESKLEAIGGYVFYNCNEFEEISIPDSVKQINDRAFYDCDKLKTVTFGENSILETINQYAFGRCYSLAEIELPGSLKTIGKHAFFECNNLATITVDEENESFSAVDGVLYNKDKTALVIYPTGKADESFDIPDSVTAINDYAFYNCSAFKTVSFGENSKLDTIGNYAFYNCVSLTEINLPESLSTLGEHAFERCYNLTEIAIPDKVTSISNSAFFDCIRLKSITFGENSKLNTIGDYAFYNCDSLTGINLPESVNTLGRYAFNKCENLTEIAIPDKVTSIGNDAFAYCNKLTTVTFGENSKLTSVEARAFENCVSLENITLPYNLKTLEYGAFINCDAIKSFEIPGMLTIISSNMFKDCDSLEEITIPYNVNSVDVHAFNSCDSLKNVIFLNPRTSVYANASTIPATATIHGYENSGAYTYASKYNRSFVQMPCAHEDVTQYGVTEPTCTQNGAGEGLYCDFCRIWLIRRTSIPALGHNYSEEFTVDRNPTCTQSGSKSRHCSRCTSKADVTAIPATGHSYGDWSQTKAPTCTATGTNTRVCATCSYKDTEIISALGHDYSDKFTVDIKATCDTNGSESRHCSRCTSKTDITVIPATGHSYEKTVVEPTCTTDGYTRYNCSDCSKYYNDDIVPATGHSYGDWSQTKAPTCTATGTNTRVCATCSYKDTEAIPALGHDYSEEFTVDVKVTCTKDGSESRHCSRCTSKADVTVIPATGHSYEKTVVDSTCTAKGYTKYSCTKCSDSYKDNYTDALGHSFGEWIKKKAPTCTADGYNQRDCSRCNKTEKETIAKLGHDYGEWQIIKNPTVIVEGMKGRICSRCSAKETELLPKVEVDIENSDSYGIAEFTVVNAQSLEPVEGATLYVYAGAEGENNFFTDKNGKVSIVLPVGEQKIAAFYEGSQVRNLTVNINPGVNEIPVIGLSEMNIHDAELTSKPMTLDDILDAGIDVENPENLNMDEYDLKLQFEPGIDWVSIKYYMDDNNRVYFPTDNKDDEDEETDKLHYHIIGKEQSHASCHKVEVEPGTTVELDYIPDYNERLFAFDGWYADEDCTQKITSKTVGEGETKVYGKFDRIKENAPWPWPDPWPDSIRLPDGKEIYPVEENMFLIMEGGVSWLKEMFDVQLLVVNNSKTDTLTDLQAELSVPEGMSLAELVSGEQGYIKDVPDIIPGETRTISWYLKGDEPGSYDVSASFSGVEGAFGETFNEKFVLPKPISVLGANALKLDFELPTSAYYGDDYTVTARLTNVSDITLYNMAHVISGVEQSKIVHYSNGASKDVFYKRSEDVAKSFAAVFRPGDSFVMELDINILFESELMEHKLQQYIDIVDGIENVVKVVKTVKMIYDALHAVRNLGEKAIDAVDSFQSGADSAKKRECVKELGKALEDWIDKVGGTGDPVLDNAVKVGNLSIDAELDKLVEDPEEWVMNADIEKIENLTKGIENASKEISAGNGENPPEEKEEFNIFNSLRRAISAIPIVFTLKDVFLDISCNSSTKIPMNVTYKESGPRYFGVSNVSKYIGAFAQIGLGSAVDFLGFGFMLDIPGMDEIVDVEASKEYITATEEEIELFQTREVTGDTTYRAWIENEDGEVTPVGARSSDGADFELTCNNTDAYYEDGKLVFTGGGLVSVTPKNTKGGTLHIEDDKGHRKSYIISVAEPHTCHSDETKVLFAATQNTEGVGVKTCDICNEVIDIFVIDADKCKDGHTYGEWKTDSEPSCSDAGINSRRCQVCGIHDFDYTDKLPHVEGEIQQGVEPTCTEPGYTAKTVCTICSEIVSGGEEIPALGHSWNNGVITLDATCTKDGVETFTCTVCGDTKTASIPAKGHTEADAVRENEKAPTCAEEGSYDTVIYCTVCNAEISRESKVVPATGHTEVVDKAVAPTCTKTGLTEGKHCSVCDEVLTAQETVAALGHTWDEGVINPDATCNDEGTITYTCTVCAETRTEAVSAKGHTEAEAVKENEIAATCTDDGSYDTVVYCSVCKSELSRETTTVPALGHKNKTATTKATLSKNGKVETKCTVCGYVSKTTTIYYPKTFSLSAATYTYDGKVKTPKVTIKDSKGKTLVKNTDYTLKSESGRKYPGEYTVTVTFKGNYSGTKKLTFTIKPRVTTKITATQTTTAIKLTWSKVTGATGYRVYKYNTKTKKYEKLKDVKTTSLTISKLKAGTKYRYEVRAYTKDNVTIWGDYSRAFETATKPATPSLKVASSKKGTATLTWTNVAGESGYQIYYSTSKSSGFKKYSSPKANSTKATISKLKSGRTYYFRVRAYVKTASGVVYGGYKTVAVKVK